MKAQVISPKEAQHCMAIRAGMAQVQMIAQITALKEMRQLAQGKRLTVPLVVRLYNSKVSVASGSASVVWETSLSRRPLKLQIVHYR